MRYAIEIDWKPGVRRLWAGISDIVADPAHCWKRKDKAQADKACHNNALIGKNPVVKEIQS